MLRPGNSNFEFHIKCNMSSAALELIADRKQGSYPTSNYRPQNNPQPPGIASTISILTLPSRTSRANGIGTWRNQQAACPSASPLFFRQLSRPLPPQFSWGVGAGVL